MTETFVKERPVAAGDTAGTLGGTVKYGPLPIEGVGQFAVALDPQGVVFSVIAINK